ncbi:MAG: hypothetical protein KUG52_06735, partial [Immundisolibacteraceae bacterium]|nr:hypothetical protein [Immundisolibacteraceae bacterium]
MMNNKTSLTSSLKVALGSAAVLAAVATPAAAVDFEYSGYLRAHYSINLSNNTSFRNGITEETFGGEGELSMARYSGKLEASINFGKFQISSVMR